MVAILGPNGAGKTTLLRCIMGFLRWGAGASLLDDRNIRDIPDRELWQAVGLCAAGTRRGLLQYGS